MKYKYLLLTAALLFYSKLASAVTLQEALALAYNNNQDIQVARQAFMGEIQAMPEALSGFMPRISADVSATNQKQTTVGQYSDNRPSTNNSSGVNRNITLRQPLFNGGSTVAAVKAAQSGFRASRGKLYAIEQDALLNSIDAYLSCYEAQETYAITNSSVEFNKQVLEATEIKLKLGEATITDVALARAQFAKSQAEKANAFAKLQSAKAVSSKMFGTELSDLALPEVPSNLPSSLDDLLVKAEAMNPSLQQATHALAAVKSNAVAAKGALLPSAEFSAALGRRYNGEETITNESQRRIELSA
ncbi:MAG: TolC family protein, partial [Pseudomonadota bacterium]